MLVLLAMACSQETDLERDQAQYLAILSAVTRPTAETLAQCQAITDENLSADCELYVATRGVGIEGPETWCPAVSTESMRSECWFSAAESWAMRGQVELAREYCDSAGAYASGCRQHLFQIVFHDAAKRQHGFSMAESEAAFVALREEWGVKGTPSAEERMWENWFTGIFQAQGRVDNGQCAAVTPARQQACRTAMQRARHQLSRSR